MVQPRRDELALTAGRQFQRLGYHRVTMADVASSAGMTAPALYRHFKNKQDLLAAATASGLDMVEGILGSEHGTWDDLLTGLAGAAMERPDLWVLVQREMRHLTVGSRVELDRRLEGVVSEVSARLGVDRPVLASADLGLLVTAALGSIASPPLYRLELGKAESQRLIGSAAGAASRVVLGSVLTEGDPTLSRPPLSDGDSRGERLLEAAVVLFNQRGYGAVRLDDIGAAVGIAGPSIYHHYSTKADLLVSAFMRALAWLSAPDRGTTSSRAAPRQTMTLLVTRYVDLAVGHPDLFGVYLSEAVNLPDEAGRRVAAALRSDIAQWVRTLVAVRPELSPGQAQLLVLAARGAVTDVVRMGTLLQRRNVASEMVRIVDAVLETPAPSS